MKKVLFAVLVLAIIGYVLVQNGGRIFLIALSQHRLANPFQSTAAASSSSGNPPAYKDGTYTGPVEDAFYGNVQVQVTISGGKINSVQFLQHPSDAMRSVAINDIAMPNLQQEAIQAQTATVDIVSGATDTSNAFIQSLKDALNQAKS
ncbi:MAG TPA: FMN-binding protein [Candidatus Acidoferrales bacterium]|nr:FMN-binding protein [Candidatus Acidoferrales bacterium]